MAKALKKANFEKRNSNFIYTKRKSQVLLVGKKSSIIVQRKV